MSTQNTHPGRPGRHLGRTRALVGALLWPMFACPYEALAQPTLAVPAPGLTAASLPVLAVLAGTAFLSALAAMAVACLGAAVMARRGLLQPMAAALAGIDAAGERLASIAGHAGSTQDELDGVTKAAQGAARDIAAGVIGLAECQTRQKSWLKAAEADQGKISALADQCDRLTEVMPALLGRAVDSMQARGLTGLDETALQLRQSAGGIEGAATALQSGLAALHESTARQDEAAARAERTTAALARQVALLAALPAMLRTDLRPAGPGEIPPLVPELTAVLARLGQGAERIDSATGALQKEIVVLAQTAGQHASLRTHASGLANVCERLARELPAQATGALSAIEARGQTVLERIESQCANQAARIDSGIEGAATRLHEGLTALSSTSAAHQTAWQAAEALICASAKAAQDWPVAARTALHGIEEAHKSAERAAETAGDAAAQRMKALDACLDRAVALSEDLPALVASLAEAAGAWPACATALGDISARGDATLAAAEDAIALLRAHAAAYAQPVVQPVAETVPATAAQGAALADQADAMAQLACRLEAAQADQAARLAALLAAPVASLDALWRHAAEALAGVTDVCVRLGPALDAGGGHSDLAGRTETALQAVLALLPGWRENLAAADVVSVRLTTQGDRLAGLLDFQQDAACRLVIAAEAAQAAASADMRLVQAPIMRIDADAALGEWGSLFEQVSSAADLLAARAQGQQEDATRMAHAAVTVAQAAERLDGLGDVCTRLEPSIAAAVAHADQVRRAETVLQGVLALLPQCQESLAAADRVDDRLAAQSDRLAGLLNAQDDAVDRLARVAAAAEAAAANMRPAEAPAAPAKHDAELTALSARIEQVIKAATLLEARAQVQEDAAARVAEAALSVAQATDAARPPERLPGIATALRAVGENATALQAAARQAAHEAARGRDDGSPAALEITAPAMLADIDLTIRRLQGAATALALASDAADCAAQVRCA